MVKYFKRSCYPLEKLYYENPYIKEFTAEIIDVIEKGCKYHVELDKSYFYPAIDVASCDKGYIGNAAVSSVYEENSKIYHVLDISPLKIHRVHCIIDFERKFILMQNYLAKHILSSCFLELNIAKTITSSSRGSYIEIDKLVSDNDLLKIEEMANKIISDNIKVEVLYPNNAELKKMGIKKSNETKNEEIRVIKISDFKAFPSKALLPRTTLEIQLLKITAITKLSNNYKIEFICGSQAVSDYLIKFTALEKLSKLLGCEALGVLEKIGDINIDLKKAISEKNLLKSELADYEVQDMLAAAEILKDIRIVKTVYTDAPIKQINSLATKLVSFPKVIVLFGVRTADKTHLLFMCSKDLKHISMNLLLKDAITLIDGKGGGSEFSAQGAGKSASNLVSSLEYAYSKIKVL